MKCNTKKKSYNNLVCKKRSARACAEESRGKFMRRMDSVSSEMRSKTYFVFWPSTAVVKCVSNLMIEFTKSNAFVDTDKNEEN